ncbi:hypothetical protein [Rhodococcus sp. IEGM 1379]|uniref:hypothetical protein n=1 Tax=Rhodococcus sp. IEGM 1379 TaxID=3047086 RepID=UPI0024B64900|nr:hypothetical protein [Rhodococcus sp. IEGM 1379]MDI9917239.1 hypothetical protein [Rhodococcus sp. IEGM 1379]
MSTLLELHNLATQHLSTVNAAESTEFLAKRGLKVSGKSGFGGWILILVIGGGIVGAVQWARDRGRWDQVKRNLSNRPGSMPPPVTPPPGAQHFPNSQQYPSSQPFPGSPPPPPAPYPTVHPDNTHYPNGPY